MQNWRIASKGRKIIPLIIILFLCNTYLAIENLKLLLPEPILKSISDWKFGPNNQTDEATYIQANIKIENLKGTLLIRIMENISKFNVYYDEIKIGEFQFQPFNKISDKRKNIFSEIKEETVKRPIYFKFFNDDLAEAIYKHINENNEEGEIRFEFVFLFGTNYSLYGFDTFDLTKKNVEMDNPIEFKTDLLSVFEDIKYRVNISGEKKYLDFLPLFIRPIMTFYKKENSTVIWVNSSKILRRDNKPILDIYIGDKLEWITDKEIKNIQMQQNLFVNGKIFWKIIFNLFKPKNIEILANDTVIGKIDIELLNCKEMILSKRSDTYKTVVDFYIEDILSCIKNHVENNETTFINISADGKIKNLTKIDKLLSDLIGDIDLSMEPLNWDDLRNQLSIIQTLIVISISGIVIIYISYYYWRRITRNI